MKHKTKTSSDIANKLKVLNKLFPEKKDTYTRDEVRDILEVATMIQAKIIMRDNVLFRISFIKEGNDKYRVVFDNLQVKSKTETEKEITDHFMKFTTFCNNILEHSKWRDK